jgi:phosphate-selective porin OprO/OprP
MTKPLVAIVSLLLIINSASANSAPASQSDQIKEIQEQLAELKSKSASDWSKKIKVGAFIQADGRFIFDDDVDESSFLIRRARIDVKGQLTDSISFRVLPGFGDGNNGTLLDAYVDWSTGENSFWRIGKFKSPIGLERVQSASRLLFIERGLTDNLVPNRDVGVTWNYQTKHSEYSIGVSNNAGDRQDTTSDSDSGKAVTIRAHWQPESFRGLGVGVAASLSETSDNTDLSTYKTSSRRTIFRYKENSFRDGHERRFAPHLTYFNGRFGSFAEYILSNAELNNDLGQQQSIHNRSWQWVTSWSLTGEKNSWKGIKPTSSYGAWEIIGRLSSLDIDDDVFTYHADLSRSIQQADSAAIGLSWYAQNNLKLLFNYEHTRFKGGASDSDRDTEKLLSVRLQLNY